MPTMTLPGNTPEIAHRKRSVDGAVLARQCAHARGVASAPERGFAIIIRQENLMRDRNWFVYGFLIAVVVAIPKLASAQLPDSLKTPGDTGRLNKEQICAPGFVASATPVPTWARSAALEGYGIRPETYSSQLDHLVPVSLGGTNSPDNLYPFHPNGAFTLEAKQALAAKILDMVCTGEISLKDAQKAFRKDWTKAYGQYMTGMKAAGSQ